MFTRRPPRWREVSGVGSEVRPYPISYPGSAPRESNSRETDYQIRPILLLFDDICISVDARLTLKPKSRMGLVV